MTEEEKMENGCISDMEVETERNPKRTKVVDFQDMPVLSAENSKSNETSAPMEVEDSLCAKQSAPDITEGASNSSSSSENDKAPQNDSSVCLTPTNQSKMENGFQNTPTSASRSKKRKRLTPEERVLKDQERQEKRRKFEEEKQRKEQERLEKIRIKEEERKKREEEKRLKEEERKQKEEERIRKAEEDRLKKEEEKQKKEEERLKKEEERKKKEEEKLAKDEQRRKKEEERKKLVEEKEREKQKLEEIKAKQAQLFTSFFKMTPPSKSRNTSLNANSTLPDAESEDKENETTDLEIVEVDIQPSESTPSNSERVAPKRRIALTEKKIENIFNPMPFQLKTDMNLAPLLRRPPLSVEEKSAVDKLTNDVGSKDENAMLVEDSECDITGSISEQKLGYVEELKSRGGRKSDRTEVKYESEVQVITGNIIDNPKEAGLIKWRIKLIQFHENRRPPYWGTYKRKPLLVRGRKPFIQEMDLDYEFDSDDEWEDEPEDAEDLENSDKEDEKEPDDPDGVPDDEEDEEGWMVPHGYLSDGEGGDHVDLETKKTQEKEFYKSLKEQTKMGFPVIETDGLSEFKIILFPGSGRRKIRRSCRSRKAPSPSQLDGRTGGGILSLELPNSDNEDADWTDDDSSDSEDSSNSSESDNDSDVSCGDITPNEDLLSSDSEEESFAKSKLPVKGKRNNSTPPQQLKKSKLKITPLSGGVSAEQA